MILLNASAAGVGASLKRNSKQHAPGASPLLGQSGGDRGARVKLLNGFFNTIEKPTSLPTAIYIIELDGTGKSFMYGDRPRAGDELLSEKIS
jgi:hypothetical protein